MPKTSLESVLDCGSGWQPIWTATDVSDASPLAYREGVLYYFAYPDEGLRSVRLADGATATLVDGFVQDLWLEGDQILFTSGDLGTQVYSVSASGGTPRLVLDAATGRAYAGNARLHAVDATDFYWTEETSDFTNPATVWRASRSDGIPVQIGSANPNDPMPQLPLAFKAMALTGDAVLLASDLGVADAVPFDGSAARPLATTPMLSHPLVGWMTGVDATGVYWTVPRDGTSPDDEPSVLLAPADGGPMRTFWDGAPAHAGVTGIWPDGDGGWVLSIREQFDDQTYHVVISLLGPDGKSQRLACSPGGADLVVQSRPVVTPDAVYVVADGNSSQLVRIPR